MEQIINDLDTAKATGYDKLPAKLLKPISTTLSYHMATVFIQCVENNEFPIDAKRAEVVPIYKKDDNLLMKNFRPVSILPSLSKILEKIIHYQLHPFLSKILDPRLSAYRKGYSCQHVLSRLVEDWKAALENNHHVAAILMDLSKAFDCLPHQLVIAKLRAYGMSENASALILSYLSSRQQRVKLLNVKSEWACLQKGVPQGSIMGPLIFNVFMNDIYLSIVNTNLYNYADDNSMAAIGRTKLEVIQCLKLDAEIAIQWFKDNKMEANPSKFQYIMLNSSNEAPLVIENINIDPEQYVKLLGVYIDSNLNFTYHFDK